MAVDRESQHPNESCEGKCLLGDNLVILQVKFVDMYKSCNKICSVKSLEVFINIFFQQYFFVVAFM